VELLKVGGNKYFSETGGEMFEFLGNRGELTNFVSTTKKTRSSEILSDENRIFLEKVKQQKISTESENFSVMGKI